MGSVFGVASIPLRNTKTTSAYSDFRSSLTLSFGLDFLAMLLMSLDPSCGAPLEILPENSASGKASPPARPATTPDPILFVALQRAGAAGARNPTPL